MTTPHVRLSARCGSTPVHTPLLTLLVLSLSACSGKTEDRKTHPTATDRDNTEDTPADQEHSDDDTPADQDHSDDDTPADDINDTGDAPDSVEADAAEIVAIDFPSTLDCSEEANGTITVRNTGTNVWTRTGAFKLGTVGDEDPIFNSSDTRVWLADGVSIAPGDTHTFDIALIGTDTEGSIISDWQMVREGVAWFGEIAEAEVNLTCDGPTMELPDMAYLVVELAEAYPDLLENSCQDEGGTWEFMDLLVDRLRTYDTRWGYNWKRGVEGDPSQDVVDYHWGSGTPEGSTDVYIIDVIVNHCSDHPTPGFMDQTEATADAGTIGRWTGRGRF